MSIPVVMIHQGQQDYFICASRQARKWNADVLAIGDANVCSHHIARFSSLAGEFETIYEHLSSSSRAFELICMTRWLTLLEIMEAEGIDTCLHLDSDVLLYANAEEEWRKYNQFDFTLSNGCCGHNSFVTRLGLKRFCAFMFGIYNDKKSYDYEKIASHYWIRMKHGLPGGVCDMTLLEYFHAKECERVGEMTYVIDGATFDHNINMGNESFRLAEEGGKQITFRQGLPYGFSERLQRDIQFKSLHFQGQAKARIPFF